MKGLVIGSSTVLVVCVLISGVAWGQATAQISGTIHDASGAVLPGVEITATQTETGIARTTITNETGFYVLPSLPLGRYRLEAALAGFRTFVQTGILLQVNSSIAINATLEVGQVAQSIEIQANAAQVETRSSGVGQVIETQRILDLPLNGRNVTDLVTLSGLAVQTASSRSFGMRAERRTVFSTHWMVRRISICLMDPACLFHSQTRSRSSDCQPARKTPPTGCTRGLRSTP